MDNAVTLYLNKYDEYDFATQYEFSVKEDWLNSYLGNTDDANCDSSYSLCEPMSIEDFLCEYTSTDSEVIYNDALYDNAIVDDIKKCC